MRNFGMFLSGVNIGSAAFQLLLGSYLIAGINVAAAVLIWPWGAKET